MNSAIPPELWMPLIIGLWVLAAAVVLGLILKAFDVVRSLKDSPEKREVTFAEQWATKGEVAAIKTDIQRLEGTVTEIRNAMKCDREELLDAGERRTIELHKRINPIEAEIGALNKASELINQNLMQLASEVHRAIEVSLVGQKGIHGRP